MIEKIIEILKEIKPYEHITVDTELIESGILDSLSILSLVTELEEQFNVEISDEAIIAQNFATIQDIAQLVTHNKN